VSGPFDDEPADSSAPSPDGLDDEGKLRLLGLLRALTADHGRQILLERPLAEPNASSFPDRWSADEEGVMAVARRVFALAGLAGISLSLVPYATVQTLEDNGPGLVSWGGQHLAGTRRVHTVTGPARLESADDGGCVVGIDWDMLDPAETVVASLCRVAAAAFRALRVDTYRASARVLRDEPDEARAIDASTVYLGLGILTTNDAYTFRHTQGGVSVHRTAGALSMEAMVYLLAAQIVVRRARAAIRRRVRSLLEEDQAAVFEAFVRELDADELERAVLPTGR
jgi:hypothetical protein